MSWVEFEFDGRRVRGFAQKLGGMLWVHLNGRTLTYQPEATVSRKKKASAGERESVTAPMPGKITQIRVNGGDLVATGQTLIVMEAMKMEYSLKAHHPAKIGEILCQVGQQVVLGQVLAKLGAAE